MKKILSLLLALVLVFSLVACGNNGDTKDESKGEDTKTEESKDDTTAEESKDDTAAEESKDDAAGGKAEGEINVISREDGSGTRSAFVEIVGVVDGDGNDMTAQSAVIQDGTGKVIETVSKDKASIGYASLGSVEGNDSVKALKVNGVEPTPDTVLDGSYSIQRPLNIAYKDGSLSEEAQNFIDFMMSKEGQEVAVEKGFVKSDPNAKAFEKKDVKGTIKVSGSTSVGPLVQAAAEEYKKINPNVEIVVNQTGSSAGMKDAMADGVVDFGMASRELKDEEKAVLKPLVIAKDGIAVIVSPDNPMEDISLDSVKGIYLGEITDWKDVK